MKSSDYSIWIGYDQHEALAYAVAVHSIQTRLNIPIPVRGLDRRFLIENGFYERMDTELREPDGKIKYFCHVSGAFMSTAHANARFYVPMMARIGWAMFCDGDIIALSSLSHAFDGLDPNKALYCVQHAHEGNEPEKKGGHKQQKYFRKNWSSVMIFNCDHPSNANLFDKDFLNYTKGRDLHAFSWLKDDEIGELAPEWNYLVGVHEPATATPNIVHFTLGMPYLPEYSDCQFSEEWRREHSRWLGLS